jgi:hypothetical protein
MLPSWQSSHCSNRKRDKRRRSNNFKEEERKRHCSGRKKDNFEPDNLVF